MKNNNNNLLNNIEESSYNDSKNKDSSVPDFVRDLSSNSINKPWYKKKASIIAMSSTLGAGILTTAIAVPLVLTSAQNTAELSKVITIYDLTNKTAKLVVEGKNLPNDKTLYSVFRETITKALTEIKEITLNFISASEISLDFADKDINDKIVYQVKLNNGASSGHTIITKPTENLKQPTFTIASQPTDVTIFPTDSSQSANFSVTASTIANAIPGQSLSYQWKMSDTNTTNDESKWETIDGATNSSYRYDAKGLNIGIKKYFKCIISYKYANSVTSTSVFVQRVNAPIINVSAEPQSVDLPYTSTNSSATLSVTANVTNNVSNQSLSYQWQISDSQTGTFAPIQDATSNTYELTNIAAGSKKYYKCTISYTGATSVDSTIVYVAKAAQSVITVTTNPANTTLTSSSTTFTLQSAATVANEISGQQISYQWQSSSTQNGTYNDIQGATQQSFAKTLDTANKNSWRDTWYQCKITYSTATPVFTQKALVKMTLTQEEAKIELLKWLAIDENVISVLTRYFNEPIDTSVKNTFYNSLHEHRFPEGNPDLAVHSIEPMQITADANYPTSYKSYKIKLKTTTPANIATKSNGGASSRTTYQPGMIIEFNTLFSFGGEKVEFINANNSKYNMILQPTFTTYQSKPTTTLLWNSDSNSSNPSTNNPIKKGNYPVKFYVNDSTTTPVISDSVLLPSRMQNVYTSGTRPYLYTMIPTYHII